ncbi:hypothetical protein [Nonomuraea rhizosphaerae]|uniref:hypothetical protein n=1 Tax=Nonomuraea rhizosphaerae TaxID=2665663 RepID=UPI001FE94486|nr:hypothetical protein [Nonomuraea rhizosphaerae]
MAFSNDKGRHRRGRWWRRGSYLFSRRGEAPPYADRSYWTNDVPDGRAAPDRHIRRMGSEKGSRESATWRGWLGGRDAVKRRDEPEREPLGRSWPGRESAGPESIGRAGSFALFGWVSRERRRADRNGREGWSWRKRERRDREPEEPQWWDAVVPSDRPRREAGERLPAAVMDRPQYTWQDFELDDMTPRAQPNRPDMPPLGDGLLHCGKLEAILHRQWDAREGPPSPEVARAVESLARLPERLKELLADGLEGIYVGAGGVPDLDDMGYLRGAPLPSGRATWDICAGAYGDGKIVVGDRPSPTPDVMMHEVGHAIDDCDSAYGDWVSDSPDFAALYEEITPLLVSSFHRQGNGLGRKEFFADAFAAIASRQRPALVDMLGGDTRTALNVMLFFNRRYGI